MCKDLGGKKVPGGAWPPLTGAPSRRKRAAPGAAEGSAQTCPREDGSSGIRGTAKASSSERGVRNAATLQGPPPFRNGRAWKKPGQEDPQLREAEVPAMSHSSSEDYEPPLKFVDSRDEITGDEYDGTQRVQMSCGHGVDPGSLMAWCRSLIDQGRFKLYCPADVAGDKCGAEVRRSAVLGDAEQREFERKLALTAGRLYCDFKECPSCRSLVERKELSHLRVQCTICTSAQQTTYEFCWQCLRAWKGSGTPSDHCANEGCVDPNLQVLANCGTKDLPGSEIRGCPSTRACPTCGLLIEHKDKCKYVLCSRCCVEFCFACLDTAQACKAAKGGAWYQWCAKPLAPRQNRIPVWSCKD